MTVARTRLDGFEVLATLAESETRMLLRARDESGTPVVIKLLKTDSAADIARLRHEHETARSLQVEGAVRSRELRRFGDGWGLVLEDVAGTPLSALIPAGGMPVVEALRVGASIAEALVGLHACGVIHGDVKPGNVIVQDDRATLVDLGTARRLGATAEARATGTPAYAAPEQTGRLDRPVDERSDLYSLGVTLYQMTTGQLPFEGDDPLALVHAHLASAPMDPARLRTDLPAVVAEMILQLLAKEPDDRYQSAAGLLADLTRARLDADSGTPVPRFALGERDRPRRLEMPDRLFGRDAELATLTEAVHDAAAGRGGLVLLNGPAGVGKSALVAALGPVMNEVDAWCLHRKFDQYALGYRSPAIYMSQLARQILTRPRA
jgi:serine/threonine protein kinase